MKIEKFPKDIKPYLLPEPTGRLAYRCLDCESEYDINQLLYTCPKCGSILLLEDKKFNGLKEIEGEIWRKIFDYRKMLNVEPLRGIFRYYEFIAPVIPLDQLIYLGEGHTPMIRANKNLEKTTGIKFYYKNDGLNPSASFKDRGMACALSYINHIVKNGNMKNILAVCASTGDTSAAAALYSSYMDDQVKSAVLLPHGKVTPQQLAQPLGSGAKVIEIPGVFDDCMKVVESLADNYHVALLNSKNSWRILGQESFSFEIAQDFDYCLADKVIILPIGNAGNITAVMSGFLKFYATGIIDELPKIIGVQSEHADPVYRYYLEEDESTRHFSPVTVQPSVAQAAMIGNPVSMPRVIEIVKKYNEMANQKRVFVVQVREQEIMDSMITANMNGNITCTQGGESLAGMIRAKEHGYIEPNEIAILDSTAHMLKFLTFQDMYFNDSFNPDFGVQPRSELKNSPIYVRPKNLKNIPEPGKPLSGDDMDKYVKETTLEIANILMLERK